MRAIRFVTSIQYDAVLKQGIEAQPLYIPAPPHDPSGVLDGRAAIPIQPPHTNSRFRKPYGGNLAFKRTDCRIISNPTRRIFKIFFHLANSGHISRLMIGQVSSQHIVVTQLYTEWTLLISLPSGGCQILRRSPQNGKASIRKRITDNVPQGL